MNLSFLHKTVACQGQQYKHTCIHLYVFKLTIVETVNELSMQVTHSMNSMILTYMYFQKQQFKKIKKKYLLTHDPNRRCLFMWSFLKTDIYNTQFKSFIVNIFKVDSIITMHKHLFSQKICTDKKSGCTTLHVINLRCSTTRMYQRLFILVCKIKIFQLILKKIKYSGFFLKHSHWPCI